MGNINERQIRFGAAWFEAIAQRKERPQTGIALLMGGTAPDKLINMRRNLAEERITVLQCAVRRV